MVASALLGAGVVAFTLQAPSAHVTAPQRGSAVVTTRMMFGGGGDGKEGGGFMCAAATSKLRSRAHTTALTHNSMRTPMPHPTPTLPRFHTRGTPRATARAHQRHPPHHRRDKIKQAQNMFNPEMMKKYSEVGQKVQALQEELAKTELECATSDGGVVVKVTGTQVPISVTTSAELCAEGVDKVSSELTAALKSAHAKSGRYAQEKMRDLYDEMGLSKGMAGMGGPGA